jgi:hypothetical protein
MKRDTLKRLYHGLNTLRWRFRKLKVKHRLERQGDDVRIMTDVPSGSFKVTEFMSPEEMLRWFEGFYCGSEYLQ